MTRLLLLAVLALPRARRAGQELGRLFFTPGAARRARRATQGARSRQAGGDRRSSRRPPASTATCSARPVRPRYGWTANRCSKPRPKRRASAPRARDGRIAVPRGESGARIGMKPGEVLDRGTGEVRDVLGEGEIRIRKPR